MTEVEQKLMKLTEIEKGMMVRQIVRAIRNDGYPKIEVHIFAQYARSEFPSITLKGMVALWQVYQSDGSI